MTTGKVAFFLFCREKCLAKKYYDKLFKEYCISDLSRYKENKVKDNFNTLIKHMVNIGQIRAFVFKKCQWELLA